MVTSERARLREYDINKHACQHHPTEYLDVKRREVFFPGSLLLLAMCLPEIDLCRARNTVRSPASTADIVYSRKATLTGSMRSADQKVNSPIRCCLA